MKTTKPMLEYLSTCSKISLESFELARLNDRANLRKHMIELLDELIEVDIQARVAEWILARRRSQAEAQSLRRIRRNSGDASKMDRLPLFSTENQTDSHIERCHGEETSELPALGENPLIPALRDATLGPLTPLRRSRVPIPEKAKRIA